MKIKFSGYFQIESENEKAKMDQELAAAGMTLSEFETVSRIALQKQLGAILSENYDKTAITSLKVEFEDNAGAGGE